MSVSSSSAVSHKRSAERSSQEADKKAKSQDPIFEKLQVFIKAFDFPLVTKLQANLDIWQTKSFQWNPLDRDKFPVPPPYFGSRAYPGIYYVSDLTLKFKDFTIPNKSYIEADHLPLHDRMQQAMAIREGINKDKTSANSVMATLGFVISTPSQEKKFVVIPINHPQCVEFDKTESEKLFGQGEKDRHSEEQLYRYMNQGPVLRRLVDSLGKKGINPGDTVLALIVDIHSIHTMCGRCEEFTYKMQANKTIAEFGETPFLEKLENILYNRGYLLPLPRRYPPDILTPSEKLLSLYYVTRVSSKLSFNFDRPIPTDPHGVYYPKFDSWEEATFFEENLNCHPLDPDITKFANSVILHQKKRSEISDPLPDAYKTQTLFPKYVATPPSKIAPPKSLPPHSTQ